MWLVPMILGREVIDKSLKTEDFKADRKKNHITYGESIFECPLAPHEKQQWPENNNDLLYAERKKLSTQNSITNENILQE